MPRKTTENRSKVAAIFADLEKHFKKPVAHFANEQPPILFVETGQPMYDFLSGGGIPAGRIIEHYGPMSSTKSTMGYIALGKFQKIDWSTGAPAESLGKRKEVKHCVLVDVEGTYTKEWGAKHGIINEELILVRPTSLEEAVDTAEVFLRSEEISFLMFDSMGAVGAKAETEASMDSDQMAANARFWNKAVRKMTNALNANENKKCTLLMINSAYEKVGMVFGDPENVKNGTQLRLAKSISTKFNALKEHKPDKMVVGRNISLYNKKNKVGRPGLNGTYYLSFVDDGDIKAGTMDVTSQLIELANQFDLIHSKGAWMEYKTLKSQGRENFRADLETSGLVEDMKLEVYAEIQKFHNR